MLKCPVKPNISYSFRDDTLIMAFVRSGLGVTISQELVMQAFGCPGADDADGVALLGGVVSLHAEKSCGGLKNAGVTMNRKMLAELAVNDAAAFTQLAEVAKANLK